MHKEQQSDLEVQQTITQDFADTFIPRIDLYPVQLENSRWISVKKPLLPGMVSAHLKGHITLGAYALDSQSYAKWLCFDADDEQRWQQLHQMAGDLNEIGVSAYLEPSRRGGHLWLFTSRLSGTDIRRFGQQLLAEHLIDDVELFPKQDRLVTGPGSLVRLPLGIHRKNGRRYHFVTLTGEPLAPTIREQIRLLAKPKRLPEAFVSQVLDRAPLPDEVSPTPTFHPPAGEIQGETPSERIKNAISVYDFVSPYVVLDGRGRGLCPFHDDHHKSFGVNQKGNYWHCFTCDTGGSVIDFWSKWRERQGQDPDFTATITELAEMLL